MNIEQAIQIIQQNYPKKAKMVGNRLKGGFNDHECELGQALDLALNSLDAIRKMKEILDLELSMLTTDEMTYAELSIKEALDGWFDT